VQVKDFANVGAELAQVSYWGGFPDKGWPRRSSSRLIQESWSRVFEKLAVSLDRLASLGELSVGFEQQAAHATLGKAAIE